MRDQREYSDAVAHLEAIRDVVAEFTGKVLASIEKALDQPPPVCTGSGTVPNRVDEREGPCPMLRDYRKFLIAYGRYAASEICKSHGTVHSREVRALMVQRGLIEPSIGDFWLGAVFNGSRFKWTGQWHVYSDTVRNIHERTIKIWALPLGARGYAKPTKGVVPPGWKLHPQDPLYLYRGDEVKTRAELTRVP